MAAPLFYSSKPTKGKPASRVPLLGFDLAGEALEVGPGCKVLKSAGRNICNLVCVLGPARSGKSFLMNCLSGQRGLFTVSTSSTPVTRGADISSSLLPMEVLQEHAKCVQSALKAGGGGGDGEKGVAESGGEDVCKYVGFVDCEGQGAEDGTYDTMLALPLLLTSKVVIFNYKGAPLVNLLLEQLAVLARASEYVGGHEEEHKKPKHSLKKHMKKAEKVARRQEKRRQTKFGHLHIVFRDFAFEGDDVSVRSALLDPEPVPKKTLEGGGKKGRDAHSTARRRNEVRALLLRHFSSVNVWLFRQPADHDVLKKGELQAEQVHPEFASQTQRLLVSILRQLEEPRVCGGVSLSGAKFGTLLQRTCSQINEDGHINVPSAVKGLEQAVMRNVSEEVLAAFTEVTETLKKRLPMPLNRLGGGISKAEAAMWERFEEEVASCAVAEEEELRATLKALAQQETVQLLKENQLQQEVLSLQVVEREYKSYRLQFEDFAKLKQEGIGGGGREGEGGEGGRSRSRARAGKSAAEAKANEHLSLSLAPSSSSSPSSASSPMASPAELELRFRMLGEATEERIGASLDEFPGALQLKSVLIKMSERKETLLELLALRCAESIRMQQTMTLVDLAQRGPTTTQLTKQAHVLAEKDREKKKKKKRKSKKK